MCGKIIWSYFMSLLDYCDIIYMCASGTQGWSHTGTVNSQACLHFYSLITIIVTFINITIITTVYYLIYSISTSVILANM